MSLHATERQTLRGHVPAATPQSQSVGSLPGTNRLELAIGLPLRNREVLTNLFRQLYNPASGGFRHYLTPEQFTQVFGPTEPEYQSVVAFANIYGSFLAQNTTLGSLSQTLPTIAGQRYLLSFWLVRWGQPGQVRLDEHPVGGHGNQNQHCS